MTPVAPKGLTVHDLNVLSFICSNPGTIYIYIGVFIHLDFTENAVQTTTPKFVDKVRPDDNHRIAVEKEAIKNADEHRLDDGLFRINDAVKLYPDHPSPLNNRAQILRLLRQDDEALTDLNAAITSEGGATDYPLVLRQAYAQRGWLHMARDQLTEAKEDFDKAAELGHPEAAKLASRCNPYAAMCNAMLAQVMQKFYSQ